jgi:hypothetical protein
MTSAGKRDMKPCRRSKTLRRPARGAGPQADGDLEKPGHGSGGRRCKRTPQRSLISQAKGQIAHSFNGNSLFVFIGRALSALPIVFCLTVPTADINPVFGAVIKNLIWMGRKKWKILKPS